MTKAQLSGEKTGLNLSERAKRGAKRSLLTKRTACQSGWQLVIQSA